MEQAYYRPAEITDILSESRAFDLLIAVWMKRELAKMLRKNDMRT